MRNFAIKVLNYRCFGGPKLTTWSFRGETLTSFVGPNNAGKSTFIRMLYEFRPVLENLLDDSHFTQWANNSNWGISLKGVDDVAEVPTFGTEGPTIVEFLIDVTTSGELAGVRISMDRNTRACGLTAWHGPNREEAAGLSTGTVPITFVAGNGRVRLDTSAFRDWITAVTSRTLYLPAFRNLINQGGATYYDIVVATDFIKLWDEWKNGNDVSKRRVILGVEKDIQTVFGFKEFSVNPTPAKDTFTIRVDDRTERVRELGAGISQFIMVLGNVAIKTPELLLIDEPELNLHPALQSNFLTALAKHAKHVVFASHSMGLARTAEHVYSITRDATETSSEIKSLPDTHSYAELLGEMSFSAYREIGFEQILGVEGVTDVRPIQQFLRLLKLDDKIVVIPLGGAQFITRRREPELGELKRISPSVAILIDSEKKGPAEPLSKERQAFIESCKKLEFNVHVTERRATEHYLTERAIQKVKGEAFEGLTPYQEFDTLRHKWSKGESWKIAEQMTEMEILDTDVGKWLAGLAPTAAK